jgi:hypothetical protein
MSRQPGVEVTLLLIGGLIGLVIGVALTVCYYSLTTFFAVSAKTLQTIQNMAEIVNETAEDEKRTRRVGQGDRGLCHEPLIVPEYPWEEPYITAMLEADKERLPERIRVAQGTLLLRLFELTACRGNETEVQAVEDALRGLEIIAQRSESSKTA